MKIKAVSITRSKEGLDKSSMDDAAIWQLRNRLLEAISDQTAIGTGWIEIKEPSMADAILSTYGSSLNRRILHSCSTKPHTIMEILAITKIPQTTGYRRIMSLVKDNFLFGHHSIKSRRKEVVMYLSSFKEVEFRLSESQESIRVKFQDNFLRE